MFKLISLSSPTGLFKEIKFKDGLNIILGKYSTSGKDINGIGKTTIINFIDYCLLSDGVKTELFSDKFSFLKDEEIQLKFKIEEQSFTISRGFNDKREVYFQEGSSSQKTFIDSDLRLILGSLMGKRESGIYEPLWFRTLMSFFIQNDHNFSTRDASNVQKFTVGKRQPELLTYIFLLLGIDNKNVWDFDKNRMSLQQFQKDQTRINKQIVEQTGKSVENFRGECDSISRKIEKLELGLDNYQFDANTSDLEEKIHILNKKITDLNKEHLKISSKFNEIKSSLEIEVDVDPESIGKLYANIHSEFSDFIKKNLEEVMQFREQISSNRSKFLKEREATYSDKLAKIKELVIAYEQERSHVYKTLDEKSAFDALKSAYNNLIEEKAHLSSNLSYIEQLDHIESGIATKKSDVGKVVAEIVSGKDELQETIDNIKSIYLDIVEGAVDIDSSDILPYFNIEFKAHQTSPIKLSLEVPRGSSLGKGRFKILAFDLTVFLSSVQRKSLFPSFLIHDGIFHAIAHKTRIKLLNYINKKLDCLDGAQYIITVNEDEIIFPENEAVSVELDFDLNERILVTLEDQPEKMFLSKEFG
ncbi:MAG: hypothetical protein ACJAZB_000011 [Psychrosphaera sp.]|jgi:uncharacterized protein YydD (DUF2326 family)